MEGLDGTQITNSIQKIRTQSVEDKMAAGTFGIATNYGWGGSFNRSETSDSGFSLWGGGWGLRQTERWTNYLHNSSSLASINCEPIACVESKKRFLKTGEDRNTNTQTSGRQILGTLSKRGRQRQRRVARKIFLRNPRSFVSISLLWLPCMFLFSPNSVNYSVSSWE